MAPEARMGREFRQIPVLSQQARMTVYLLQLPLLELKGFLEQEMLENPMLESVMEKGEKDSRIEVDDLDGPQEEFPELLHPGSYDEEDEEKRRYAETLITKEESLEDHLLWQLGMFLDGKDYEIGEYIIFDLDDNGYLRISAEEIAGKFEVSVSKVEEILSLIQTFDPIGAAARDVKECLLVQLKARGKEGSLSYKIVENYLEDLEKNDYAKVAKALDVKLEEVEKAHAFINTLEPKPGRTFAVEKNPWSIPDIVLKEEDDSYTVELNNKYLPVLKTSKFYSGLIKDKKTDDETKEYLKMKRDRAKWIIKAILQRQDTIKRIADFVVNYQKGFFENPEDGMKPLKLEDVAKELSISESTVSRVVAKKHIQTEFGILLLKSFFSTALKQETGETVSADHIKNKIKEMIASEDSQRPLSDQRIVDILKQADIKVARRTVAKYRESIKILPAHLRKR